MQNDSKSFEREKATDEEWKQMYQNRARICCICSFDYELYEALAEKAKSREEYEFYMDEARLAFKSAEALTFGP